MYDLAIIGGGPGGSSAAEFAALNGLKTIVFEQNAVGGVCLNEGCIPTKTLLYSAKILHKVQDGRKYAINASDVALDLPKLIARKNKFIKKFRAGIKQGFREKNVKLVEARAFIKGKDENGHFVIEADGETYTSKKLILATGSETVIPPIKGVNETKYWTSREALNNKEVPDSLVIIGGGVIGMEFVSFFKDLGTKVTVVEMLPKILGETDDELSEMLLAEFAKKGVIFHLSTRVIEIKGNTVCAESENGKIEIEAEKIMWSVGRKAILDGFGLKNLHLEKHKNGLKVNEHMQTSDPDVYACGDITGFSLLAHTASREGQVAVNHILGNNDAMHYHAIPAVVYTNPEIAGIGKTEKQLNAEGVKYTVKKVPMSYSGRFNIENDMSNGVCKLIINEKQEIIGGHILGNPSSEIIVNIGIAIEQRMTAEQLSRIVFPHPTVSEIVPHTVFPAELNI